MIWPDQMRRNVASALARGLRPLPVCHPHDRVLSVAGGGPSLADTAKDLTGTIATMNGSLGWLIDNDAIPPGAHVYCGVLDPGDHMADIVRAHPDVSYFVASICDPAVFDKLKDCHVVMWHPVGFFDIQNWVPQDDDFLMVGGGCTMGLRWLTLGYTLGFRRFELHGLDSSYRDGQTHAYKDHGDRNDPLMVVHGRTTQLNFTEQVSDFRDWLERIYRDERTDPITLNVHGDGLLQDEYKRWTWLHGNVAA